MKLKVINRDPEQFTRERSQDLRKVHKNLDPTLHPFEKAVEYTRCSCSTAEHRRAQQDHLSHCGTAALSLVGQEQTWQLVFKPSQIANRQRLAWLPVPAHRACFLCGLKTC